MALKDNALVLMATTRYTGEEFKLRIRRRPTTAQPRARPIKRMFGEEAIKVVKLPSFAVDYNDHMGGVDIGDQLKAGLGLDHRNRKGNWRAMAWSFLLETALVNSYLLQRKGQPNWQPINDQKQWREHIVRQICEAYGRDGSSRQRLKAGDIFTPLSQHNHVQRGKGSNCVACEGFRAGQTRQKKPKREPLSEIDGNSFRKRPKKTKLGCDKCDVPICTQPDCWYFYHSDVRS